MHLERDPPAFADLVFHVMAHVARSADQPASLYDPVWIRFAAEHLGPAEERTLAEDAEALGISVRAHEALATLQLLAWLFRDLERAGAASARDLQALEADEVDAPELIEPLLALGPAAELLRLAALLERPSFEKLPPARVDWERVEQALAGVVEVAPELGRCSVALVRSLRLRGRVRGPVIWVGAPDDVLGPSVEHVSWQAAHEATVREVGLALRAAERRVEQMAVVLLSERAAARGHAHEHARWLAHFGRNAPNTERARLSDEEQRLVGELLHRGG